MEKCVACLEQLQAPVKFCPYCGKPTTVAPVPEVLAPVPVVPLAKAEPQAESRSVQEAADDKKIGHVEAASEVAPIQKPVQKTAQEAVPKEVQKEAKKAAKKATPEGSSSQAGEAQEKVLQPVPVAPPRQEPKPTSWSKKWLVLGLAVVAVVWFFARGDGGREQCQAAVDNGLKLLKAGKVGAAASQSSAVQAACTGKLAVQAASFETELGKATRRICTQPVANIRARLQAHRLSGAATLIEGLDAACAQAEEVATLRAGLAQAQNAATAAEQRAALALDAGDGDAARQAIAELNQIDRENKSSVMLNRRLSALLTRPSTVPVVPAPEAAVTGNVVTSVSRPSQVAPVVSTPRQLPAPTPAPAAKPAPNPAVAIAENFLRQAESALAQKRFDAAKTYIESAHQVDPSNSRIESLRQRVRAEERKVLEGDTTIR